MEFFLVIGVAILVSLVATLIQKKLTDIELIKSLKNEIKKISKEIRRNKENSEKVNELMKKSFEIQKKMIKQTMRPTLISGSTILVTIYLLGTFLDNIIFKLPISIPIVGNQLGWIWIFILISVIMSLIFRKIFDLGF